MKTDEKMHYLIIPLAFLSPENPMYEEMKAGMLESVMQQGHIPSYALRESTMLEDGLRIVTDSGSFTWTPR